MFRSGNLKKVLTEGKHWVSLSDRVSVHNMAAQFDPGHRSLDVLLRNKAFAAMLDVVQVADNEVVLIYENGNLKGSLTPGRYTWWKGLIQRTFVHLDASALELPEAVTVDTMNRAGLGKMVLTYGIAAHEKAFLFVNGTRTRELGPGAYYFWNNTNEVQLIRVDMRQVTMEVSGQELLTKDKAVLRINFFAQYRVTDLERAVANVEGYKGQLYLLLQYAVRQYVGGVTLDALLEDKQAVADFVMERLAPGAAELGIVVSMCGVKDIILPGEMKAIMNQVLIAQKEAQANVIARREENASTRSMLNTAKLLEENAMLLRLKEMEYVEKIAEKVGEITVSGNGRVLDQLKGIFSGAS